jgi:hypothetical protein
MDSMKMTPISLRLDKEIHLLLRDGKKRTPLKPAELIRRTLRDYLAKTIERESKTPPRVTNVEPLARGVMTRIYKKIGGERWDDVEASATAAQPLPSGDD